MVYIPGVSDDTLPAMAPAPASAPYLERTDPEFHDELIELACLVGLDFEPALR